MSRNIAKTGQVFRIGTDCQAEPKKSRKSLTAEQVVVLWPYREPGSRSIPLYEVEAISLRGRGIWQQDQDAELTGRSQDLPAKWTRQLVRRESPGRTCPSWCRRRH